MRHGLCKRKRLSWRYLTQYHIDYIEGGWYLNKIQMWADVSKFGPMIFERTLAQMFLERKFLSQSLSLSLSHLIGMNIEVSYLSDCWQPFCRHDGRYTKHKITYTKRHSLKSQRERQRERNRSRVLLFSALKLLFLCKSKSQ